MLNKNSTISKILIFFSNEYKLSNLRTALTISEFGPYKSLGLEPLPITLFQIDSL